MAVDRLGTTIAPGQVMLLAGRVLFVDGDQVSIVIGDTNNLVVKCKAGDVVQVDAATAGGGGGVTDHGALTGLADDDHTQYARIDGSRNFTGSQGTTSYPSADTHLTPRIYVENRLGETIIAATLLFQALNANLTALSALTSAANKLPYFTGSGAAALTDLSSWVRANLLNVADATAARSAISAAAASHGHDGVDIVIDDSEFTGAFAGQGITDVQALATWLDANLGA